MTDNLNDDPSNSSTLEVQTKRTYLQEDNGAPVSGTTVSQSNEDSPENVNARNFSPTTSNLSVIGKLYDKEFQFIIDTGAAVSAISTEIYDTLPEYVKTKLSRDTSSVLRSVSGQDIPVLGRINLPFSIDGKAYSFQVFVAQPLSYDVILGKDFLRHFNALIDLKCNTLTLPEGNPKATQPSSPLVEQCTLHLLITETLPPLSQTLVAAKLKHPFDPGITGIIEPKRILADKYNVCGAVLLATTSDANTVPVRLLNPTTAAITLYQHTSLGLFTRLDNPTIGALFDNSDSSKEPSTTRVEDDPLHFDLTESELQDDQKTQLLRLLNTYRDIFAKTTNELGWNR